MLAVCLSFLCSLGTFLLALIMSWRDIRSREVLDRELACFAFLAVLPRAMPGCLPAGCPGLPLWMAQVLALGQTTGGALLLSAVALPARLAAGRDLLGWGDVLFALAAGFMLPGGASVPMVCLAFLLALPFSLAAFIAGKKQARLPFIPFLSASAFLIRWLPLPLRFF